MISFCLTTFVRNTFHRGRRGCRFFRVDFAFFGPDPRCRIGLLPLVFRHLAERMFFARYAKQQHAERNSSDAVAEEKSHNALAQLSASLVACKPKARDSSAFRLRARARGNDLTTGLKDAAAGLLSDAVARTDRHSAWNEVFALVLLFSGTLLFFALISYTPKDIPSWFWFSHVSPANHPAQNFIGPVGAIVAGICYQLIGVFASLLLAAVLLGFGAAKLFYPRLRFVVRIPWIVLFLVSGACLDQAWGISQLLGRKVPVDIQGPGGLIGYRLSDEHRGLLPVALGPVGSVLLVVGVYLTTLILVTGLRPIHLVREMVNLARRSVAKLHEWRVRRSIRKSDLKEQLKTQKGRKALEALQKQLKKKGVPMPEPAAAIMSPELANRPAPKVVDTTVP